MRINDAIWGALLLLLAAALIMHVQSFPTIPGQQYGPALMPGMVGVGLGVCGALLIIKAAAVRRSGQHVQWAHAAQWTRSPRHALAFAVTVAVNVFYVLAVSALGFILTGTIYLAALFAVFGVKPARIVPIAVVVTLVIHYVFYKLLRVPLPWGVLQGIAW